MKAKEIARGAVQVGKDLFIEIPKQFGGVLAAGMAEPVWYALDQISAKGWRKGLRDSMLIPGASIILGTATGLMNESLISGTGVALCAWAMAGIGQRLGGHPPRISHEQG